MNFTKLTLAALFVIAAASSQAQIVTYTNLANFQAASGATTLETFTNATAFNTTGAFGPNAYTGFSLSGNGNGNNIGIHTSSVASGGPNYSVPAPFDGQKFFGWGDGGPGNTIGALTITFAQPTKAFAFDWFNTDYSDQYQISFGSGGTTYSGPPFTEATGPASSGFFGVVSATSLTSATITPLFYGGYISDEGFDNVRVTAPAAVPEPGSIALFAGMGISGAGFLARRRKQARAAA